MSTIETSLHQINGHLIADLGGRQWIIDTGAPTSFGAGDLLNLCGKRFEIPSNYMSITHEQLSGLINHKIDGLLGADILNELDWVLHTAEGKLVIAADPIPLAGPVVAIESFFMGVPLVEIEVAGTAASVFFDTGAPISYLQDTDLSTYPDCGTQKDFYPGFGEFQTSTHRIPLNVGGLSVEVICGALPDLLGMTLGLVGSSGILGNEPMIGRMVGYFPRREEIVFA
jgi:hypothetical protein